MKPNVFYLAAMYAYRVDVLPIAALLMMNGHTVQAAWLNGTHDDDGIGSPKDWALQDLQDIESATHVVLFNLPTGEPEPSAGRHIEYGYALAKGKTVIVVGGGDSVYFELADQRFDTMDDFLAEFAPTAKLRESRADRWGESHTHRTFNSPVVEGSMKTMWVISMESPYFVMKTSQFYAGYSEGTDPVVIDNVHGAAQFENKFDADVIAIRITHKKDFVWRTRRVDDFNTDGCCNTPSHEPKGSA